MGIPTTHPRGFQITVILRSEGPRHIHNQDTLINTITAKTNGHFKVRPVWAQGPLCGAALRWSVAAGRRSRSGRVHPEYTAPRCTTRTYAAPEHGRRHACVKDTCREPLAGTACFCCSDTTALHA